MRESDPIFQGLVYHSILKPVDPSSTYEPLDPQEEENMEAIPSLRQINRSEPRAYFGKLVKAQSYPMPDDHQFSWEFQF